MENSKKIIALYRVSTETQDLQRQQMDMRRTLAIDGIADDQIIEIGNKESGVLLSAAEREGIKQMKQHVETGNIAAVYVHELSRLSRRAADTFAIRDYLQQHHVQLICLNPAIKCFTDDWKIEPTANMVFGIMASMAENEGYIRKERFRTGKARNAAQGKYNGGRVFFGYKLNAEKRYVVDDEQAAIVRRVFSEYTTTTITARQLAKRLYAEGLINQQSEQTREARVLHILRCVHYVGNTYTPDGTIQVYPRIITYEEFTKAQDKLNNSQMQPKHQYSGMVCYGHGIMFHNTKYMMLVRKYDASYISKLDKGGFSLNINAIDSFLLKLTADTYKDMSQADRDELVNSLNDQIAECKRIYAASVEKAKSIKKSIQRVEERYIMGKINEQRADDLQYELEKQLDAEEGNAHKADYDRFILEGRLQSVGSTSVAADVYELNDEDRRKAVHRAIKRIDCERIKNSQYQLTVTFASGLVKSYRVETKHRVFAQLNADGTETLLDVPFIKRFSRAGREQRQTTKKAA